MSPCILDAQPWSSETPGKLSLRTQAHEGRQEEMHTGSRTCTVVLKSPNAASDQLTDTTLPVCVNWFCFFPIRFLLTDPVQFFFLS